MRKHKVAITYFLAGLLSVFISGCGQEVVNIPTVVSTIPANGDTNVLVNTSISATFSTAMNASTITTTTFTVVGPDGTAIAGSVTYSGTTATFMPSSVLAYGTLYTGTITTGAKNLGGTSLISNYSWSFTTVTPPPTVVATIPANGAADVPVSQVISATFSEAMSPATISGATFLVTGPGGAAVAGTVTYAGVTATFTPTAALVYGTVYTGTITTGAMSSAGIPLAANYVWTFTTEITPPPAVTATIPASSATGVPLDQIISATFNEAMDCTTLASPKTTFFVTGPGMTHLPGSVTCTGTGTTFTPAAPLTVNTVYTAAITRGAKNVAGITTSAHYIWSFRTLPAPTTPTVISTVPANGATTAPVNQALSATFSVAMDSATIDAANFTVMGPGGVPVAGAVTYVAAGSVATFTPAADLLADTLYTATILTGAMDLDGKALAQSYVWTFTTSAVVVTPPTVIATIPLNAATDVALNQVVSATFSMPMDPATINLFNFKMIGPGDMVVPGLVAYASVGNTLTFTPKADWAADTLFTATITTGATNLAGTGLASDYAWTFTTGTADVVTPPELVATVPANAATNVPLNQAVSATFSQAMNPLTLTTGTFKLTGPGGTAIAATLSYDSINFIATLTPSVPLLANSIYTATVTNGATDLAGNPLGNTGAPNPWTFTTGVAAVLPPVVLGPTISLFGGFGGTAGMTNQGIETVINGNIGTTAVSTKITGFHDMSVVVGGVPECTYTESPLNIGRVNGIINSAPPPPTVGCPNEGTAPTFATATQAALEALAAYNTLAAIPNGLDVSLCPGCGGGGAGELGNRTLAAGTYKSAAGSYAISMGDLTLDAKGDPNASWVFQMATTLTVGTPSSNRSVLLVNGAQAKNVFWQVGTAATINGILGGGTMYGTIISQAGVSISTAGVVAITTLNGRALVLTGPVTMVNAVINVP